MCLSCEKTFINDARKLAKTREHLETIHCDKKRDLEYIKIHRQKLRAQPDLGVLFTSSVGADMEGGP